MQTIRETCSGNHVLKLFIKSVDRHMAYMGWRAPIGFQVLLQRYSNSLNGRFLDFVVCMAYSFVVRDN